MVTARLSVESESADAERKQDTHLQRGIDSGALDLSARRASLDAGRGLTSEELLARALKKRGISR